VMATMLVSVIVLCCSIASSDISDWSVSRPVPCQPCVCQASFTIEDSVKDTFINMNVSTLCVSLLCFQIMLTNLIPCQ